jgi:sugar O-acyltransferase (sialic acid O-acetyltransferase NeuD family)
LTSLKSSSSRSGAERGITGWATISEVLPKSGGSGPRAIVIVCAGGHGAIVADALQRARDAGADAIPIGFVDDTPELLGKSILGITVLGPVAALADIGHDAVFVALGDNRGRRAMTERLLAAGEHLVTVIHPFSCVAPSARVGEGSMIAAGAVLAPRVELGRGTLLNTNASVDHDSVVGDFAHVSAGAIVGAKVRIGEETLIALGASVTSGMKIGARTLIGSGAVVVRDIPDDVVAWGAPARVRPGPRS